MISNGNGHEREYEYEHDDFADEPLDIPVEEYVDLERQSSKWRWVAIGLAIVFGLSILLSLRYL